MVTAYGDALRRLWSGRCSVYIRKTRVNEATGRDEPYEVPLFQDEPCRISFRSIATTTETNDAARIQQTTKLFIAADLDIPAGSKINVTQSGKTKSYTRSGEPAYYSTHQEIMLAPFERWA